MTKKEVERIAEKFFTTTRLVISRADRDNFMKAMRAAIIAYVVAEGLDGLLARAIYERAEEMLLSPEKYA